MPKNDLSTFTPESWKQFQDYKAALAAAAEDTNKLHTNVDGLLAIMSNAGTEGERLANALKGGPLSLAITAAVDALHGFFSWVEKAQAKQRQMILDLQEFNKFQHEVIRAGGDMYENARKTEEAIAGFEAKMNSLNEQLTSFENRAKVFDDGQSDKLQSEVEARRGESSATLAHINLLETMGEISPDQAEQLRIETGRKENLATIQDRVKKAKSNYNNAASNYTEELKIVGGEAAFSPQAIGAASDAFNQAQGKYNQAQILAGLEGQAQLDAIDQKIQANKGGSWDQTQELQKQRTQLAQEIKDAKDNLDGYRKAVAVAQQRLNDLKSLPEKFANMKAQLEVLLQKWKAADDLAARLTATANEEASALSLGAEIKGRYLNKPDMLKSIVTEVYGIEASKMRTGNALDPVQAQILTALLDKLEKVHINSESILQVIIKDLQDKKSLEQVLNDLSSQLSNSRNNPSG